MSVKKLECQLAQAQLGRYLVGDAISPEALVQLEKHFEVCGECQHEIKSRKQRLEGEDSLPVQAVVQPAGSTQALEQKKLKLKPLILSSALALTLVAMSYLSKNPASVFGNKVAPPANPNNSPTTTEVKPLETKSQAHIPIAEPVAKQKTTPNPNPPKISPQPEVVVPKADVPVANPKQKIHTIRAKKAHREPSGISIYDETGKKIS